MTVAAWPKHAENVIKQCYKSRDVQHDVYYFNIVFILQSSFVNFVDF